MKFDLFAFSVIFALYLLHDAGMTALFRRRYGKQDYYLGGNAPNEMQRFFGVTVHMVFGLYALVFLHMAAGFTFGGFISDIAPLDIMPVKAAGLVAGGLSLFLMTAARLNLGASWRVGLDNDSRDALVTSGFYRFMRNPYYTFLFGFLFSIALISPNAVSIFAFLIVIMLLNLQVRQEEEFLLQKYGKAYAGYMACANRFLPHLPHSRTHRGAGAGPRLSDD